MASSDVLLEQQLKEVGNRLMDPPTSVEELLPLLDQVDNCLSRVEQSPAKPLQNALSPALRALVSDELLRHSDVDVKVSVASCISEVTRITAPDAPYDDDQMKEIFQLIVSSFENLSDKSSRSYTKRTSILETVAKVRSCVVMLDLECDALILEMFQHFLKAVRDYHPENVLTSMETIMTLVLEESEDISMELLSLLLSSVKRDTEEFLPTARKLTERVLESCATKLKPCLMQAVKSSGISLEEYSEVVTSVCQEISGAGEQNDAHVASEQMAEESKLKTSSDDDAQEDKDMATIEASREQVDSFVEKSPELVTSNGVTQAGDVKPDSLDSEKQELDNHTDQFKSTDTSGDVKADSLDTEKAAKTERKPEESKPEQSTKKRGKKSKVLKLTEPTEAGDKKESEKLPDHCESGSKDVPSMPPHEPNVEADLPSENDKDASVQLPLPKALECESANIASQSPTRSLHDENHSRKLGRPKKKESVTKEVTSSADDPAKQAYEVLNTPAVKPNKRSGKKVAAAVSNVDKTPTIVDAPKIEAKTTSDSEATAVKQSVKKMDISSDDGEGSPLKQTEDKKRRRQGKAVINKDGMVSSPKSGSKSTKVEHHLEETPKTNSKRKFAPAAEKASDTKDLGENLIGSRVKVWWPQDKKFYEGVVHSFNSAKKKHKVLYVDGDEEILNLKKEKWEFIIDDTKPDEEEAADKLSPEVSSEMPQRKKAKVSQDTSKKGEIDASPKRVRIASSSKSKSATAKSGRNSKDVGKIDGKSKDENLKTVGKSGDGGKTEDHTQKGGSKSVDVASKSAKKSKNIDTSTPKSSDKSNQDTPKVVPKSKGKPAKSDGKSNPNGTSKVKSGSSKVKESEDMVDNATDSPKAPESVKASGPKTGKKRQRGARS